ncbi:sensitivity to high expression protein she9, partial [Coemansia sp. RSA 2399]
DLGPEKPDGPRSSTTTALVPLNVIYLPPPHWHTPLRPLKGAVEKEAPLASVKQQNTLHTEPTGASVNRQNGNGARKPVGNQGTAKEQASFSLGQMLSKLFSTHRKGESSTSSSTSSKDGGSQPDNNSRHPDVVSRWQRESALFRALVSTKSKLDTLRLLPKDDDWITWVAKALNQTTGYDRIADLKAQVENTGTLFHQARQDLDSVKQKHSAAIKDRIASQREINSLLQRKHLWNEDDVARFTTLYRMEHQSESAEQSVAKQAKDAEALVDRRYDELVNSIRMRYHEEQIWSDKIRRASTYGIWAVLIMNIMALFLAQAIFEPRKRRKIVAGVDDKITAALNEQQEKAIEAKHSMEQRMESHEKATRSIVDHLSTMSAVLGAVAARQEAQVSAIGAPMLNGGAAIDPAAMALLGGNNGYSDTELDMYYAQQQAKTKEKMFTKSQARQMAAGVAVATSFVIGMATYYLAT